MPSAPSPDKARKLAAQIPAMRRKFCNAILTLLRARRDRCHDRCPGWVVDHRTFSVEVCDDCAGRNNYRGLLSDDDVAILPVAQRALDRVIASDDPYEMPDTIAQKGT